MDIQLGLGEFPLADRLQAAFKFAADRRRTADIHHRDP